MVTSATLRSAPWRVEATDGADVLKEIRRRGFELAIWVAPFIAQANSHVFQRHPDWFIKRADGTPLPSSEVTFGGWRFEPWYAVDGTHPETQKHLESLFRTMRREWGCTYFKLDANFWGAMQGGRREQLSPGLQSSHLAVAGIDRWLAQLR